MLSFVIAQVIVVDRRALTRGLLHAPRSLDPLAVHIHSPGGGVNNLCTSGPLVVIFMRE